MGGCLTGERAQPTLIGTTGRCTALRGREETMRISMLRWIGLGLLVAAGLASTAPAAPANDRNSEENRGLSVTVAFGSGLNTLPPPPQLSGPPNHHILPPEIKIHQGGVVHFMVSGFHQVVVYDPGTKPEDIVVPSSGTFTSESHRKAARPQVRHRRRIPSTVPIDRSRSHFRIGGLIW